MPHRDSRMLRYTLGLCTGILCATAFFVSSCGPRPLTGSWFKNSASYDFEGQSVSLRFLDRQEISDYVIQAYPGNNTLKQEWEDRLAADFPRVFPPRQAAISVLAPIALGIAIDAIAAELDREATLYEAQFGVTEHKSGFWKRFKQEGTTWKGEPRWYGFEVLRTTAVSATPAFRAVFAIVPASEYGTPNNGDATADERLFMIKPLLVDVRRTRAKVSMAADNIDLSIAIRLDAIWIDPRQAARRETIADASFEFPGTLIGEQPGGVPADQDGVYIDELSGKIAGWFAGVPVSLAKGGEPRGNGTFTISVVITEKDSTKTRELIERSAKYLRDNKARITGSDSRGAQP